MYLNLFLYKDKTKVLSILNQKYLIKNEYLNFIYDKDLYKIKITPNNFIFIKENEEQLFKIDNQKDTYKYLLKEHNYYIDIPCTYHKYTYNKNKVEFVYQIDSDETLNKIIIELKESD